MVLDLLTLLHTIFLLSPGTGIIPQRSPKQGPDKIGSSGSSPDLKLEGYGVYSLTRFYIVPNPDQSRLYIANCQPDSKSKS